MKKFLVVVGWLLLAGFAISQEKDLVINASQINYDKEKNLIEAVGSVEASYKDFKVSGEHLVYHTDTKTLFLDQGFDFRYGEVRIAGQVLDYRIKEGEGKAEKVQVAYKNVDLDGLALSFDREKINLIAAHFTTCGLGYPHYRISAAECVLYPKIGWVVAYWGLLWLGNIPTIPVPAYIYDVEAEKRGRRNVLPIPSVGVNDEDGLYISENLAWNIRRDLNGTLNINYMSKKGWGGGVETNYIVNDFNKGNVRIYGNPKDNYWGGLTHNYSFGEELKAKSADYLLQVLPSYRQFELETLLSYRERINYQRVSQLPSFTLTMREGYLGDIRLDGSVSAGLVSEEGSGFSLGRFRGVGEFSVPVYKNSLGTLTPILSLDGTYYTEKAAWLKSMGKIRWEKDWSANFQTFAGYSHYFSLSGTSPFWFELYRFNPNDTVNLGLVSSLFNSQVGVEAVYNIPQLTPYDLDFLFKIGLHCYNIAITYRAMRNEFNLGVSLN